MKLKEFSTITSDIRALRSILMREGVEEEAIESTGILDPNLEITIGGQMLKMPSGSSGASKPSVGSRGGGGRRR
jgi:hypothetical protein